MHVVFVEEVSWKPLALSLSQAPIIWWTHELGNLPDPGAGSGLGRRGASEDSQRVGPMRLWSRPAAPAGVYLALLFEHAAEDAVAPRGDSWQLSHAKWCARLVRYSFQRLHRVLWATRIFFQGMAPKLREKTRLR